MRAEQLGRFFGHIGKQSSWMVAIACFFHNFGIVRTECDDNLHIEIDNCIHLAQIRRTNRYDWRNCWIGIAHRQVLLTFTSSNDSFWLYLFCFLFNRRWSRGVLRLVRKRKSRRSNSVWFVQLFWDILAIRWKSERCARWQASDIAESNICAEQNDDRHFCDARWRSGESTGNDHRAWFSAAETVQSTHFAYDWYRHHWQIVQGLSVQRHRSGEYSRSNRNSRYTADRIDTRPFGWSFQRMVARAVCELYGIRCWIGSCMVCTKSSCCEMVAHFKIPFSARDKECEAELNGCKWINRDRDLLSTGINLHNLIHFFLVAAIETFYARCWAHAIRVITKFM